MGVRWRSFSLREIPVEQGNTAFAKSAVRLTYNWRDIERRAGRMGIPFAGRRPYPVDPDLLTLRVGVVAAAEDEGRARVWDPRTSPSQRCALGPSPSPLPIPGERRGNLERGPIRGKHPPKRVLV